MITNVTPAEIAAAELWLIGYLVDNAKPMRLPSILHSACKAGHLWRHVLAARRKPSNGVVACRDANGEWAWKLSTDERKAA
ncbi:hypothetical protein [Mesorhizobium sp.]|uniref:hypothetical protein n=1 Tax=Mesorhizobium sp. TaxID=1871066 RepID=UPI000FE6D711|nr:hypothetical protein [Mesorhizobium sp.]RWD70290.1 MAG: hypothetical protein EOS37_15335 [Mesorhizobium sp.]